FPGRGAVEIRPAPPVLVLPWAAIALPVASWCEMALSLGPCCSCCLLRFARARRLVRIRRPAQLGA
ncbi:MAG: hypothetical protein ACXW34_11045, partial [Nitrospira sp.]